MEVVLIANLTKRQYKQIEDRLYRYADIDDSIAELQTEIEHRKSSQSCSIVEFGVTGGQLISSVQERFYTRPDIMQMMEKISQLKDEKCKVGKVINSLSPQERQTFEMCFVRRLAGYEVRQTMGITRMTMHRRKNHLMDKMLQNLT